MNAQTKRSSIVHLAVREEIGGTILLCTGYYTHAEPTESKVTCYTCLQRLHAAEKRAWKEYDQRDPERIRARKAELEAARNERKGKREMERAAAESEARRLRGQREMFK